MSDIKTGTKISHLFKIIGDIGKKVREDFSFYPETAIYMSEKAEFPCVAYRIFRRRSASDISGRKPRFKSEEINPNNRNSKLITKSQQFESIVEFSIWGKSYDTVDNYREWFEEFIIRHTDEIRKEGMLEILFDEQLEDQVVDIKENYFIRQPLRYYVRNERITESVINNINDISTKIDRLVMHQDIKDKLKYK